MQSLLFQAMLFLSAAEELQARVMVFGCDVGQSPLPVTAGGDVDGNNDGTEMTLSPTIPASDVSICSNDCWREL